MKFFNNFGLGGKKPPIPYYGNRKSKQMKTMSSSDLPIDIDMMLGYRRFVENPYDIILGRSEGGKNVYLTMSDSHFLFAGATRSGKSVAINNIVYQLAIKNTPDKVGFFFIDPKMVEFSIYKNLPHTLGIAYEEPDTIHLLNRVVSIMEGRYHTMMEAGQKKWTGKKIFVIFDEYASFSKNRVITGMVKDLARKSAAAGIVLMIATQYPVHAIINNQIKANVSNRIVFKLQNKQQSKTVLDFSGAENLTGSGDGLMMDTFGTVERFQGHMISDRDIKSMVKFYTDQL